MSELVTIIGAHDPHPRHDTVGRTTMQPMSKDEDHTTRHNAHHRQCIPADYRTWMRGQIDLQEMHTTLANLTALSPAKKDAQLRPHVSPTTMTVQTRLMIEFPRLANPTVQMMLFLFEHHPPDQPGTAHRLLLWLHQAAHRHQHLVLRLRPPRVHGAVARPGAISGLPEATLAHHEATLAHHEATSVHHEVAVDSVVGAEVSKAHHLFAEAEVVVHPAMQDGVDRH